MCSFLKGMGAGLMVGVCVGVTMTADKRRSKKMINRAVRNMGDMMDRLSDALGM